MQFGFFLVGGARAESRGKGESLRSLEAEVLCPSLWDLRQTSLTGLTSSAVLCSVAASHRCS